MKSKNSDSVLGGLQTIRETFAEVVNNKFAQIAFILFTGAFTLGFAIGKACEISLSK